MTSTLHRTRIIFFSFSFLLLPLLLSLPAEAQEHPLDEHWSSAFGLPGLPGGVVGVTYLEDDGIFAMADSLWQWDGLNWSIVSVPVGEIVVDGVNLLLPDLRSRSILEYGKIYSIATVDDLVPYNQIVWSGPEGGRWSRLGDTLPPGQIVRIAVAPDGEAYVGYQSFNGGKYSADIYHYDGVEWNPFQEDLPGILVGIVVAPDGTPFYGLQDTPNFSISWTEGDSIATVRYLSGTGAPGLFQFHGDSAYALVSLATPGHRAIGSFNRTTREITILDSLPAGTRFPVAGGGYIPNGDEWIVTTRDGLIHGGDGEWEPLAAEFVPARLLTSPSGRLLGYIGTSDSSLLLNSIGIAELDLASPDPTWRGLYDTTGSYWGLLGQVDGVVLYRSKIIAYGQEMRGTGPEGDVLGPILENDFTGWRRMDGLFRTRDHRPVRIAQMISTQMGIWTIGNFDSIPSGYVPGLARWNGEEWIGVDTTSLFEVGPYSMVMHGGGDYLVVLGNRSGDVDTTVTALWDGTAWIPIDAVPGISGGRLAEGEDVGLVVGGAFGEAHPLPDEGIAAIFPATGWRSLGGGLGVIPGRDPQSCTGRNTPRALDMLDSDGLYVGGIFHRAGDVTSGGIARWNPEVEAWESVGFGLASTERCVEVNEIGWAFGGVVASGDFQQTDTTFPSTTDLGTGRIAFYDPETDLWTPFGSGLRNPAEASTIRVNDIEGYGRDVFIVGTFERAGGKSSVNIARFWIPDQLHTPPVLPDTLHFGTVDRVQEISQEIIITNPLGSTRTVELRLIAPADPFMLQFVHDTGSVHNPGDTTVLRLAPGQSVTARIRVKTGVSGTFSDALRIESAQLSGFPKMIILNAERTTVGVEEEIRRMPLRLDLSAIDRGER